MTARMKATILGTATLLLALSAPFAHATPGALNSSGCHGRHGRMGYHCHNHSETRKFDSKNQRYVPCARCAHRSS